MRKNLEEVRMGRWLEGKELADKIKDEVKNEVLVYKEAYGKVPGLTVILVGEDRASQVYVRSKEKCCQDLGMNSNVLSFAASISQAFLEKKIKELNRDEDVDGILVQLPLPAGMNPYRVISLIDPAKDVDGFHPFNLGLLMINQESLKPCTPLGIIELLKRYGISLEGRDAVVIGRSMIVGKPLAAMLTNENATVTVCHSKTKGLPEVASRADILVAAIGRPLYVSAAFVKEGAAVIDVGMNSLSDRALVREAFGENPAREKALAERGYTLVGDVDPRVIDKAGCLTPVPGGVGLLTVAMLMRNTMDAFKRRRHFSASA